jgi:hypothetical protein
MQELQGEMEKEFHVLFKEASSKAEVKGRKGSERTGKMFVTTESGAIFHYCRGHAESKG